VNLSNKNYLKSEPWIAFERNSITLLEGVFSLKPLKKQNPLKKLFEGFVDVCSMLFEGFEKQNKPCKKQKAHDAHSYAPVPSPTEPYGHFLQQKRL